MTDLESVDLLGRPSSAHDYLDLDSLFTPEELALRDRVRAFVDERIRPNIAGWYEAAHFPRELVNGAGRARPARHAPRRATAAPAAAPSSTGWPPWSSRPATPASAPSSRVQGSLAMSAIHKYGSEEQKQRVAARDGRAAS